jgi:hypothetical protein
MRMVILLEWYRNGPLRIDAFHALPRQYLRLLNLECQAGLKATVLPILQRQASVHGERKLTRNGETETGSARVTIA